jgi:hypothetical protein
MSLRDVSESVVEFDWNYLLTLDIRSIRNSRVQKGRVLFHVIVEIFKKIFNCKFCIRKR